MSALEQAVSSAFGTYLAAAGGETGATPPPPREVRAVAELRKYLDRRESDGDNAVAIVAVRMILGKV